MSYTEDFEKYCNSIIVSKTISIPDTSLSAAVRLKEFNKSCHLMAVSLSDIFIKEIERIEKQASSDNQVFTHKTKVQMTEMAKYKIKTFIQESEDEFKA